LRLNQGRDEDTADTDLVFEGELGAEMARVLDLLAIVRHLVEHDQDIDIGSGVSSAHAKEPNR
jgi:hypothetical protein